MRDNDTTIAPGGAVSRWADGARELIARRFYGSGAPADLCLVALLCRGHVLIDDVPGTGKTLLARLLAAVVGGRFRQVQCTPDLLPADILGVSVFHAESGAFRFREGPIVTNTLLVDEINRATPRTQSALLEAMAEGQVSVESRTMKLPDPFFLIATESPLEAEGTFPLPEVQKDRFFLSLRLGYPAPGDEARIMRDDVETLTGTESGSVGPASRGNRVAAEGDGVVPAGEAAGGRATVSDDDGGTTDARLTAIRAMQEAVTRVHVAESLSQYILSLVTATRGDGRLAMGVSPRGSLALFKGAQALAALRGRDFVTPEDIKELCLPVLRGRLLLKPDAAAHGLGPEELLSELLAATPVPAWGDGEE